MVDITSLENDFSILQQQFLEARIEYKIQKLGTYLDIDFCQCDTPKFLDVFDDKNQTLRTYLFVSGAIRECLDLLDKDYSESRRDLNYNRTFQFPRIYGHPTSFTEYTSSSWVYYEMYTQLKPNLQEINRQINIIIPLVLNQDSLRKSRYRTSTFLKSLTDNINSDKSFNQNQQKEIIKSINYASELNPAKVFLN